MNWSLILTNQPHRIMRRIPHNDRDQIKAALRLLVDNPFAGDIKRLQGGKDGLRRRVGDWRILYKLDGERRVIVVTAIKRRGSNTY